MSRVAASYGRRAELRTQRNVPQQNIGRHAAFTPSEGRKSWCAREERQICEWKNYTEHRGSYAYVNSLVGLVFERITFFRKTVITIKLQTAFCDHASPFDSPMKPVENLREQFGEQLFER
jgi:hypothetical protein